MYFNLNMITFKSLIQQFLFPVQDKKLKETPTVMQSLGFLKFKGQKKSSIFGR